MKYPGSVTGTFVRQGASYSLGTIIDGHLTQADEALLYQTWKSDWPEPLAFSGGVKAITCEMVLEVPEENFLAAFAGKKGKDAARRIRTMAQANTGR